MKLSTVCSLFFLQVIGPLTVSAGAIVKRTFAVVQSDLKVINNDLIKTTQDVNAYSGSLTSTTTVSNDLQTLDNDIRKFTADCQATVTYTSAEAQTLANYCNNTLEPSWRTFVTAFKNKRAAFTAAGARASIKSQLAKLQTDMDAGWNCVTSGSPAAQKSAVQSCSTKIHADLEEGINYYS